MIRTVYNSREIVKYSRTPTETFMLVCLRFFKKAVWMLNKSATLDIQITLSGCRDQFSKDDNFSREDDRTLLYHYSRGDDQIRIRVD